MTKACKFYILAEKSMAGFDVFIEPFHWKKSYRRAFLITMPFSVLVWFCLVPAIVVVTLSTFIIAMLVRGIRGMWADDR